MDSQTIFTKTAKGLKEAVGKTNLLSRDLRKILKEIDGKATMGELPGKLGNMAEAKLQEALNKLAKDDYIREFITTTTLGENTLSLDFSTLVVKKAASAPASAAAAPTPTQLRRAEDALRKQQQLRAATEPQLNTEIRQQRDFDEWQRLKAEEAAHLEWGRRATDQVDVKKQREADAEAMKALEALADAGFKGAFSVPEPKQAAQAKQAAAPQAKSEAKDFAAEQTLLGAETKAKILEDERKRRLAVDQARREAEQDIGNSVEAKLNAGEAERLRLQALAREELEGRIRVEAEEKARKAGGQASPQPSAEQGRIEAEAKARRDVEALARRQAEERARAEAEASAKQAAEQLRRQNEAAAAEAAAKAQAEALAKQQAEAGARLAVEAKAKLEEAERVRLQALARKEQEEKARLEAEEKTRQAEAERKRQEAEEKLKREAEALAKQQAEATARRAAAAAAQIEGEEEERARLQALARKEQEERARAEAEAKAKREADQERLRVAAEAKAKRELEEKAIQEAEERVKREAAEKARIEAEAKARKEAEQERLRKEAEEKARRDAEENARRAAEEKARREAEARAKREAEELLRKQTEELVRREAAEKVAREAALQAQKEADEIARMVAEAQLLKESEEMAVRKAEDQARRKAEEQEKLEAREQAQREAEEKKQRKADVEGKKEVEEWLRQQKEDLARQESESRQNREVEEQAKRESEEEDIRFAAEEQKAREAQARARAEQEADARHEAELLAKQAAQEKAAEASYKPTRAPIRWGKPVSITLLLLFVGSIGLAHVMSFDGAVRAFEKAAGDELKQPVKVKKAYFSMVPRPHWRLEGVTIGKDEQIRAAEVKSNAALGEIFGDVKTLSSVEINSPVVTEEGLSWILFSGAQGSTYKSSSVTARNVQLKSAHAGAATFDVQADFGEDGGWKKIVVDSNDKKMHVELQPKAEAVQVDLTAEAFTLPFGSTMVLDKFKAVGRLQRGEFTVTEFTASVLDGTLTGNAKLKYGPVWGMEGEFNARQIDVLKLAPGMLESGRLEGKATFAMQARSGDQLFAAPRTEGIFVVRDGVLRGVDLVALLRNANAGGKSQFSELTGGFVYELGKTQLRRVNLAAKLLTATGVADVDASGNASGRFQVELKSSTTQLRTNVTLSGTLAQPNYQR